MGIILINISKCALRGIDRAMKDLFKVTLEDPPQIIREELSTKPRLCAEKDECLAIVLLKHEEVQGSGFIAMTIKKKLAKRLLGGAGIVDQITDEIVADACGEFVSLVAGSFKVEMHTLGRGLINISVPKTFIKGVDQELTEVEVFSHYLMEIHHHKEFLMTIELSFHSTNFTEADDKTAEKK